MSRPQPAMLKGLSRFLIMHERCGDGFDVAHPAGLGSGRVSITCRGCGARHEYATATIEVEREIRFETRVPGGEELPPLPGPTAVPPPAALAEAPSAPAEPPAAAEPPPVESAAGGPGRTRPARRSRGRRFWGSPTATIALIGLAALAAALAGIRVATSGDDSDPEPAGDARPVRSGAPEAGAGTAAGEGSRANAGRPVSQILRNATPLETQHYTVRVPQGWWQRSAEPGLLLAPRRPGAGASVQIFFDRAPELSMASMSEQTAELLRARDPEATLSEPRRVSRGGQNGFVITARGPRQSESALALSRGPYRYLLVRKTSNQPSPAGREAAAIERSFRAR